MSVKELILKWPNGSIVKCCMIDDKFVFISDGQATFLDRAQAHLLMLYLQEHLK